MTFEERADGKLVAFMACLIHLGAPRDDARRDAFLLDGTPVQLYCILAFSSNSWSLRWRQNLIQEWMRGLVVIAATFFGCCGGPFAPPCSSGADKDAICAPGVGFFENFVCGIAASNQDFRM